MFRKGIWMHHEPCCFLRSGRWIRGACFSFQISKRDFRKTAQNLANVPSDEGHIVPGLQPGNLKWRERDRLAGSSYHGKREMSLQPWNWSTNSHQAGLRGRGGSHCGSWWKGLPPGVSNAQQESWNGSHELRKQYESVAVTKEWWPGQESYRARRRRVWGLISTVNLTGSRSI